MKRTNATLELTGRLCARVRCTHSLHACRHLTSRARRRCRSSPGGVSGPTLALSGVGACLEMDLLLDDTWPVAACLQSGAAVELVAAGLLEALKGALSKFQGAPRLLGLQAVVLVSHQPALMSKCGPDIHSICTRMCLLPAVHTSMTGHARQAMTRIEINSTAQVQCVALTCMGCMHADSQAHHAHTGVYICFSARARRLISEGMLELSVLVLEAAVRDLSRGKAGRAQPAARAPGLGQHAGDGRAPVSPGSSTGGDSAPSDRSHSRSRGGSSARTARSTAVSSAASSVLHRATRLGGGRTEAAAASAMQVRCAACYCAVATRALVSLPQRRSAQVPVLGRLACWA